MTMTATPIPLDQVHPDTLAAIAAELGLAQSPHLPPTIAANARELDDLRTAKKVIEEREGVLRAALLLHLDAIGQDADSDGQVSFSRSKSERKGIDRAKMEALYPKVLEAVTTTTPVVQVRVKIKG